MQAVYWYAVLLLQPTLYLVSAPGSFHGPGMGKLVGEKGASLAENEQTTCTLQPALPRPPGAGPGLGRGGAGPGREISAGPRPVTSPRGRSAPLGRSRVGVSRAASLGATSRTGSLGVCVGTRAPPRARPARLWDGGNFLPSAPS